MRSKSSTNAISVVLRDIEDEQDIAILQQAIKTFVHDDKRHWEALSHNHYQNHGRFPTKKSNPVQQPSPQNSSEPKQMPSISAVSTTKRESKPEAFKQWLRQKRKLEQQRIQKQDHDRKLKQAANDKRKQEKEERARAEYERWLKAKQEQERQQQESEQIKRLEQDQMNDERQFQNEVAFKVWVDSKYVDSLSKVLSNDRLFHENRYMLVDREDFHDDQDELEDYDEDIIDNEDSMASDFE